MKIYLFLLYTFVEKKPRAYYKNEETKYKEFNNVKNGDKENIMYVVKSKDGTKEFNVVVEKKYTLHITEDVQKVICFYA